MKRVFLDTNIILDIFLQRDPFYADAAAIWLKIESNELEGLVSLQSLGTIFYLLRKRMDTQTARKALQTMCRVVKIADSPAPDLFNTFTAQSERFSGLCFRGNGQLDFAIQGWHLNGIT